MARLSAVIENNRLNAVLAWIVVAALVITAGGTVATSEALWVVFPVAGIVLVVFPAAVYHDTSVVPPWEVAVIAAVPSVAHAVTGAGTVSQIAAYVTVVSLSLLAVVELHVFSPVELPPWFAVVLVVFLTMAVAGLWTVIRYASDVFLGTTFIGSLNQLMWDLVTASVVGVLGGPLVALYLRDHESVGAEPFEVAEEMEETVE
jgi:hypothetical protein